MAMQEVDGCNILLLIKENKRIDHLLRKAIVLAMHPALTSSQKSL